MPRLLAILSLLAVILHIGCSDDTASPNDDTVNADVSADTSVADLDDPDAVDAAEVADTAPADAFETTDTLDPLPDRPWSVTEPGHYAVGYRETSLTYQPDGGTGDRRLRLAIWYPTRQSSGIHPSYMNIVRRDNVTKNAAVAPDGPFPVLVFSHGSGGFAEQSFFLTEFFATHGWIVASPDHTGNTVANSADPVPAEIFFLRPQDISQVIDFLQALPADDPLHGQMSSDLVVAGHSFGGYTSLAVAGAAYAVDAYLAGCAMGTLPALFCDAIVGMESMFRVGFHDPRVKAIVPQAPSTVAFDGGSAVDIPVLLITGSRDRITTNFGDGDPLWRSLDGPRDMRVDFANGGHFTFSDACMLAPGLGLNDGCGADFVDLEEAHRAIDAYALAFARAVLWGDTTETALLAGTETISSDVTVSHK